MRKYNEITHNLGFICIAASKAPNEKTDRTRFNDPTCFVNLVSGFIIQMVFFLFKINDIQRKLANKTF